MVSLREALLAASDLGDDEYLRWSPDNLVPGQQIPPSNVWFDGNLTDEVLPGTCVIDPRQTGDFSACDLDGGYMGDVYVVRGEQVVSDYAPDDPGEVLLRWPIVVRRLLPAKI